MTVWNNDRWQTFSARAGDIIISSPPKCGTTWMQTMCALLICAVVIGLFLGAFFGRDVSNAIGVLFIAALSALAAGLVTFLREIYLALRNLRIGPLA